MNFLSSVCGVVWGPPMLMIFLFTALRFTVKSKAAQIRDFPNICKMTVGSVFTDKNTEGISQFSAFCSVLGACLGTGNIVGVATALYSGGPGVVFWMWLSAMLSMMTAYSENFLGAKYSIKGTTGIHQGGAFSYMEKGLKMKSVAKIYGVFSLASAIGMGNMTQSNSLADTLKNSFNIPPVTTAVVASVLCLIIICGGIKRIAYFQTLCVPSMTLLYLIISVFILFKFRDNIIPSITLILKEAFSLKSVNSFNIYTAMRFGISRGVFSNEAGLGSSTLLHAQTFSNDGKKQGMWAMMEVFADTVIMCTLTALVILVSTNASYTRFFGAELSALAFSSIGKVGKQIIGILTATFAFTSLTGCSFYGEKSLEYLNKKCNIHIYKIIYALIVFIGCINPPKAIWVIADICNGLMALPNLFALNILGNKIEY